MPAVTRVLADIARVLASPGHGEDRLREALERLRDLLPSDRCALLVAGPGHVTRHVAVPEARPGEAALEPRLATLLGALAEHPPAEPVQPLAERGRRAPDGSRLAVPLIALGRVIGLLYAERAVGPAYGESDLHLLTVAAGQFAAHLTLRHLAEEEAQQARELREARDRQVLLADVGRLVTQSLDPGVVAQRIVDGVRALLAPQHAIIYRLEPESGDLVPLAFAGDAGPKVKRGRVMPHGTGVVGLAVREGRPVVTPDLLADPRVTLTPEFRRRVEKAPYRVVVAVPLRAQDRIIGVFALGDGPGRAFTDAEVALLEAFASPAAAALENAHIHAHVRRRAREAEALAETARALAETLDVTIIAERVVTAAMTLLGVESANLRTREPGGALRSLAAAGLAREHFGPGHVLQPGIGLAGRAVIEGRPARARDLSGDAAVRLDEELRSHYQRGGMRAGLAVPLRVKDSVQGVLVVGASRPRDFSDAEVALLQALADHAALALENARLVRDLTQAQDLIRYVAGNSPDAIVTTDGHGRVTSLSPAAREIFGYRPEELLGRPVAQFYRGGRAEAHTVMQRLQRDGRIRDYETAFRAKDGRWIEVWSSISLLADPSGTAIGTLGVIRDVTERKRAEESLRHYADRLATLNELGRAILAVRSPEAVAGVALDHLRKLVPYWGACVTVFDFDAREAITLAARGGAEAVFPPGTRAPLEAPLGPEAGEEPRRDGLPVVPDVQALAWTASVIRRLQAEGSRSFATMALVAAGEVVGALSLGLDRPGGLTDEQREIAREVADLLAVAVHESRLFARVVSGRERLRALSRRLVEVQEAERRAMARELHDEIGQVLTGLKLMLQASQAVPGCPSIPRLGEAEALVDQLITRVRSLSLDLRPAILDDLGLLPALLWHLDRYTDLTGVAVHVEHEGLDRRFPPDVETAAYRIVQEALSNIARHAAVRNATLRLWATEETLGVQVEDQGGGFDATALPVPARTGGLTGMRERAQILGGRFVLDSAPGEGTRVTVELPLTSPEGASTAPSGTSPRRGCGGGAAAGSGT